VQAGSTAWNALYGNKRLMAGDTVLVLGMRYDPMFVKKKYSVLG
jgi:hypothetical protein